MRKKKWTVAAIDVGTTKICSAIAVIEDARFEILGIGQSPSRGLRRGTVINLSETIESIKTSLEEAERQAGINVDSAWVSIGGEFVRGMNRRGETEIRGKHGEVSEDDIHRAVAVAKSQDLPRDHEIIHVLVQGFWVDDQDGIVDPSGMTGRVLGVKLHMVINASAAVQNIVSATNKAGVIVDGVVMQQLASAEAMLSPDEKDMGTIVADIGGGTTDIAVYSDRSVWHSEVLPIGGNLITRDVAIGLRVKVDEAEMVKCRYGSAIPDEVPDEEVVQVQEMEGNRKRAISRRVICQIIHARCEQIVDGIAKAVERSGLNHELFTGVVLTGGGAELRGMLEKARRRLGLPARLGYPINVAPLGHPLCKPIYCTALGLLRYCSDVRNNRFHPPGLANRPKGRGASFMRWVLGKMS
jgi:cell division protein FtsA